jgi:hypothetical protein
MWAVELAKWTTPQPGPRQTSVASIQALADEGRIASFDPAAPTTNPPLARSGIVVNCPVLAILPPAVPQAVTPFLRGSQLDLAANTVTLPLCKGRLEDEPDTTVLYIVTDASTPAAAEAWGANAAAPLAAVAGVRAAHMAATVAGGAAPACGAGNVVFPATVDFGAGKRSVTPGPTSFPPSNFTLGARAGPAYSPLITLPGGAVLNAPHVGLLRGGRAVGQAGRVVRFAYDFSTVTLSTTRGFAQVGARAGGAAATGPRGGRCWAGRVR